VSAGGTFEDEYQRILEQIARGAPLPQVLLDVTQWIEKHNPDGLCSILLIDHVAGCVRAGAAPSLPSEYTAQLDGLVIGPEAGSCGTAAYLGQRVIVEDIATHPYWARYRDIALPFGLRACWSSPILSPEGVTLGTFAIYYREVRKPRDQELRWVDAATHLAAIAILNDRSQRALRDSEERLRAVIENTPDVSIQWYDDDGRLLFFNRASERTLGLKQGNLGKTLLDVGFWDASEEGRFATTRAAARRGDALAPVEFRFVRPDGSEGWLLSTVFQIPSQGGSHTVCMDVDVTAQRRLQTQLNQAQRLTALGTLAGGIAHDFNNILTAIRANADLGVLDIENREATLACLKEVQKASQRAAHLVRQILTFSRNSEPNRERLDLCSVIDEVLQLLKVSLPKTLTIQKQLAQDAPLILGDATQVHQVLVNLLTNASHAIKEGNGTITVSLSAVQITSDSMQAQVPAGSYARLTVSDTGCGMDDAVAAHIFEPFFTTKAKGEGTGLGLSVVHGIMKAHGGSISVTSRVGQGTTFSLYFPAAQQPGQLSLRAGQRRPRILLVDDDEALAFLAQRVLERRGYCVTACASPVLALQEFVSHPDEYDLLVTDMSMPGMSGIQLLAQARVVHPALPAVLTSGCVRPQDADAVLRLGNARLVEKPLGAEGYVDLVLQASDAASP
jgi:PAS domain S-box-containing protein